MKKFVKIVVVLLVTLSLLVGCSSKSNSKKIIEISDLYDEGKYQEAFNVATVYVEKYSEDYLGFRLLGWINYELDEYEKATENFEKALSLNDKDDNSYVGLGVLYRSQGDYDKAIEYYNKSLEINEDNAPALGSLVFAELYIGEFESAIEHGEKAWQLSDKKNAVIASNLCIVYHYAGKEEKRDEFLQYAKDLEYESVDVLEKIISGEIELDIAKAQ